MIYELKILGLKILILLIAAPLLAASLLYIAEKIEDAWKLRDRKKKFQALLMLMVFAAIFFGWLL